MSRTWVVLQQLMGVKYVDTDMGDWFNLVSTFNTTRALMFAPEVRLIITND